MTNLDYYVIYRETQREMAEAVRVAELGGDQHIGPLIGDPPDDGPGWLQVMRKDQCRKELGL